MSYVEIIYQGYVRIGMRYYRSVLFKGIAKKISDKRVKVISITHIDGVSVKSYLGINGNGLEYDIRYNTYIQKNKIKNINTLLNYREV